MHTSLGLSAQISVFNYNKHKLMIFQCLWCGRGAVAAYLKKTLVADNREQATKTKIAARETFEAAWVVKNMQIGTLDSINATFKSWAP